MDSEGKSLRMFASTLPTHLQRLAGASVPDAHHAMPAMRAARAARAPHWHSRGRARRKAPAAAAAVGRRR
eukprot:355425-Chlamydomonas_euryale.AAC.3